MKMLIFKKMLEAAKKYITEYPELMDQFFAVIIGLLFPQEATFAADDDTPAPVKLFAAECEEILAADAA